ncbi:UNVERIFIED_CONTAM: type II secretion system F family protein [Spiribacter pallidus]|jgi:tight adherence protein C|uniref:type II secretion system F family protein n=1 Tax=Spiribacter pallidus TaxID=1987936 RepID=UPI00349F42DF
MAFFASGLVGVSVALAVVAVAGLAARVPKGAVRRRHGQRLPALLRLTLPLARVIAAQLPIGRSTFDRRISLQLERAGLQQILTPVEFYVLGACTACLLIVSTMLATTPYSQSSSHSVLLVAVASTCGLVYPWVWLRDTIQKRQNQLARQLPLLLDLLQLSIRAGLGFSAALAQCSARIPSGALQNELSQVNAEIRAGARMSAAVQAMARRSGVQAVEQFAAAIAQSQISGAGLADLLQHQAEQQRDRRFAQAEKAANEAPVRLLLPLMTLLFPLTFAVIAAPIVFNILEAGWL